MLLSLKYRTIISWLNTFRFPHNFYFRLPLLHLKNMVRHGIMTKILRLALILSFPFSLLFFSNCHKEVFGNGHLSFSTDTLTFDTVFATLGSTTRYFKVFNKDKKSVKISDIR